MTNGSSGRNAEGGGSALRVRGVSKSFPGTRALSGVDLDVAPASVHGLVGENGCGKSTLVKIIAGVYQADAGTIEVGDSSLDAAHADPATSQRLGVRAVHQDAPIFPGLTVAENLLVGGRFPTRLGRIDRGAAMRQAAAVLERFHIDARPETPVAEVDLAVRAMVSIARELQDSEAGEGGVLVLDEPTARLNEAEVETLLASIRRYAADGQAIVLVSHRLDEVMSACDRLTVLRDGSVVATESCRDLDRRRLVGIIVGSELAEEYESHHRAAVPGDERAVVARVEGLNSTTLRDVHLEVTAGEIVGLAGIDGAGPSELLRAIYGSHPRSGGRVEVLGADLPPERVGVSRARSIEYVPPDRGAEAAFGALTVRENLSAGELKRYWRRGHMNGREEVSDVAGLIERFGITPPDGRALMSNLSGGNQQKVVIARAFRREPALLLLDEPSNGVDVGARAQIHHAIRAAVDAGAAALVNSSDLEELTRLCDRVLVFVDGRITFELESDRLDRKTVSSLIHHAPDKEDDEPMEASA